MLTHLACHPHRRGPRPDQVAHRLIGGIRDPDSRQLTRPMQLCQHHRIATVGLDPVLRRDLWALFRRLADQGTTLLVSSHVMDEAKRCDRLLLLRQGRLLADDSPDGLLARTGAPDAEQAFFALIENEGAA